MKYILSAIFMLSLLTCYNQQFKYANQLTGSGIEQVNDMVIDASGNSYLIGIFSGSITLGNQTYNAQSTDIWLAKYNSSGTFIWGKVIPNTNQPGDETGLSIDLDNNNNVYIYLTYTNPIDLNPGGIGGTSPGLSGGIAFAKYSSNGTYVYSKYIDMASGTGAILVSNSQSKIFIGGKFLGPNIDFDPGPGSQLRNSDNGEAYLARYTLDGVFETFEQFGEDSEINNLVQDNSNNIYVVGALVGGNQINLNPNGSGTSFDPNNGRVFMAKYDGNNFGFIAATQFQESNVQQKNGIDVDNSGNIYVSWTKDSKLLYSKFNSNLQQTFEKALALNGNGVALDLEVENDGTTYITGEISGSSLSLGNGVVLNPTGYDAFIAKYNSSGTAQSGIILDSTFPSKGTVIRKHSNSILVGGDFQGSSDFNACLNTSNFSANNVDGFFTKYELDNPWYGNPTISGPSLLCNNSQSIYSIDNAIPGSNINWSTSSNFTIVSGQNSSSLTIKGTSGGNGNGWISASFNSACGSYVTSQYPVWLGKPNSLNSITVASPQWNNQNQTCPNTILELVANDFSNNPSITTYDWSIQGATILSGQGTSSVFVKVPSHSGTRYLTFAVRAQNSCGYSSYYTIYGTSNPNYGGCGGGGDGPLVVLYPNPNEGEFNIRFSDVGQIEEYFNTTGSALRVTVSRMTGEVIYRGVINKKGLKVDLKNPSKGIYNVLVEGVDFNETATLLINQSKPEKISIIIPYRPHEFTSYS